MIKKAGVTYQQLHADRDDAIAEIVDLLTAMADECDAVVVVGSDYTDASAPLSSRSTAGSR